MMNELCIGIWCTNASNAPLVEEINECLGTKALFNPKFGLGNSFNKGYKSYKNIIIL